MSAENTARETYISVDVEAAGPNPGRYSMLSIGACTVFEPIEAFYIEIKPINDEALPEALAVSGLDMRTLKENGLSPKTAMHRFEVWVQSITPSGSRPVFVAFNAPFDWMFVNDYFHRYLGRNPFGHNALDIKAFYMGMSGGTWHGTSMQDITRHYFGERELSHHALRDALDQAEIFRRMLAESRPHKMD